VLIRIVFQWSNRQDYAPAAPSFISGDQAAAEAVCGLEISATTLDNRSGLPFSAKSA